MKTSSLVLVLLLVFNLGLAYGQSSCFTATPLGKSDTCLHKVYTSEPEYWFSFVADSGTTDIILTNDTSRSVGHVHRLILYAGSCNGLIVIDSADVVDLSDAIRFQLEKLTVGTTYYVAADTRIPACRTRCSQRARFDLCFQVR
ncbi:MAG: hypothetical protein AB1458_08620 [Bacteroidota bacterium]